MNAAAVRGMKDSAAREEVLDKFIVLARGQAAWY